jgi:hypothetical protein
VVSTKTESERDFISELDAHKTLLNLDQVKLSTAGAPGANLEPCDFLSTEKLFIRPYYLVPDGKVGHDAFAVIRETIRNMDMVAIGRVVLAPIDTARQRSRGRWR